MKRFSRLSRFSLPVLLLVLGLSFSIPDAEARRLGGGVSSGMKREGSFMQRSTTPPPSQAAAPRPAQAAPATPPQAAPQASGMRRWLGPLAGLAAGVGLAALFSHFGMGAGMGSFLMLLLGGLAVFMLVRWLMNRNAAPQMQPAMASGYGGNAQSNVQSFEPLASPAGGAASPVSAALPVAANVPAGFDTEGFLRQAKLNFIRLQAANDSGNMDDIRAFTAPELCAEIQMQYQERGKTKQQTDVAQLDAALLDVADAGGQQIASVRFHGLISEVAGAAPEPFEEIWHLTRPADGRSGWIVAGIEQPH